jgi:hypothetical protein
MKVMLRNAAVACLKLLLQHLSEETEANREKLQPRSYGCDLNLGHREWEIGMLETLP